MTRLRLVLLLVIMGTSGLLVHLEYQSRKQLSQLFVLEEQGRRMQQEQERLLVMLRDQATPQRIQEEAARRMGMIVAGPSATHYLHSSGFGQASPARKDRP